MNRNAFSLLRRLPVHIPPGNAILLLVTLILAGINYFLGGEFFSFEAGGITFPFYHMGAILVAGLCGYATAMYYSLMVFAFATMADFPMAYTMFLFLVIVCLTHLFLSHFTFTDVSRTVLAIILLTATIGNGKYTFRSILSPTSYPPLTGWVELNYFLGALPECVLSFLALYIFYTYIPEDKRRIFSGSQYYTSARVADVRENGYHKRSILGRNITIGLVINIAIMLITSISFAGLMFGQLDSVKSSPTKGSIRFGSFYHPIFFAIELLMMISNVVLPIVLITYYVLEVITLHPMEKVSTYARTYATSIGEDRKAIAEKIGDIEPHIHDEIWDVFHALDILIHETNDYIDKLQNEQDLENELAVAQEASKAKSTFLSNMSHEIRTPINAILGMNEMIIRQTHEQDTLKLAMNIKSSSDTLLNIVNDILDLSKIEAGKMEIINAQYDLSNLINNIIGMVDLQAEHKGLKLDINVNPDTPTILHGDENRIKQCILNLLSNAVKYTQEGSVGLYIDFHRIDSRLISLHVRVTDTGVGIQSENIDKLFIPYERLDERRNRAIEGTGLGLDIVNRLLSMMESRLQVHSIYGEGSTFSFTINQTVLDWEPIGDVNDRYLKYKTVPTKYTEGFHAPHARILVVDDTNMNLIVIKGLLKNTQIQIDTADSGREALTMIRQKKYDIIFLDHRMPGMDGIETHDLMMSMEDNPNKDVPCIALTANAITGARETYIQAGFQDYLSKPVNSQRLENMIIKYLPDDMVIRAGDSEFVPVEQEAPVITQDAAIYAETEVDLSEFDDLEGVNIKIALKNCDTIEILREALHEFLITIPGRADAIEAYSERMDFRNFTVAVHALKSNARLIGAMKLSDEAAALEQFGNNEDAEQISTRTPHLLRLYRSYTEKLASLKDSNSPMESSKEEISEEMLLGAFHDMQELIEVFDYDNAQSIMNMVECYRIPEKYTAKWERIKTLMAEVDLEELLWELQ